MKNRNWLWTVFSSLLSSFGLVSLTHASIPARTQITNDTNLHQELTEIRIKRDLEMNFDAEVTKLAQLARSDARFREPIPRSALKHGAKKPVQKAAVQKPRKR